jgi:hypothetical protein
VTATDTRTLPDHGKYARYTIHGCRCDDCREASNAYNRDRDRLIAYGRWQPLTDAEPIRRHLHLLAAAGIGPSRIPKLAGVPSKAVSRLLYQHPPVRRIKTATADAILAVRPAAEHMTERSRMDAFGCARRLRALAAVGFPLSQMGHLVGVTDRTIRRVLTSGRIYVTTGTAIAEAYERLKDSDPAAHGIGAQAAAYARGYAARQGWPAPSDWDGQIDNPDADPNAWVRDERAARTVEDIVAEAEELRCEHGLSWEAIAERVGVRRDTLHTYRGRVRERAAAQAAGNNRPEARP